MSIQDHKDGTFSQVGWDLMGGRPTITNEARFRRLPGISNLGFVSDSHVRRDKRNTGIGTAAHSERLEFMKQNDFDFVLATVESTNEPQLKIMKKFGWRELARFTNSCTCHTVIIFGKDLT